jgi:Tat protein translocase TatB subunit
VFNIGFTEILIILVIGLIFIGPKQLPEIAKSMGRFFAEFNNMKNSFLNPQIADSEPAEAYEELDLSKEESPTSSDDSKRDPTQA